MKILLLISSFLILFQSTAQLTYVPDNVFESFLENTFGASDGTPNNGYVLTSQLQGPGATFFNLIGSAYYVTDLTGIEDFTNLQHIYINGIGATAIDLSSIISDINYLNIQSNGPLLDLHLPNGNIGLLTVQYNSLMQNLIFGTNTATGSYPGGWSINGNNSIEEIDMSMINVVQPKSLQVTGNTLLRCFNMANGGCVVWSLCYFISNPSLYDIVVDNPNYSNLSSTWSWNEQTAYLGAPPNPYQYTISSCSNLGNNELLFDEKIPVKIVDLMGRETEYKPNTTLIYVYSDGTVEKVFKMEY